MARRKHSLAREPLRFALLGLGWLLIAVTPVIGPLPGPGGLITFGLGAGLVLKNSFWAKKHYCRFKRRHPRYGHWTDWSLRRGSARRRAALAKQKQAGGD